MLAVVFSQRNDRVLWALLALGVAELPPSDRGTVKEVRAQLRTSASLRGHCELFSSVATQSNAGVSFCGAHYCHQPQRVYLVRKFLSEQNILLDWYL